MSELDDATVEAIAAEWRCEECKAPWATTTRQCLRCGNRTVEPVYVSPRDRPEGTCQSFDNCREMAGPGGLCPMHQRRGLAAMGEDPRG